MSPHAIEAKLMQFEPSREKQSNPRMLFDLADKLVWVAGQHGMVGGAVMRRLRRDPASCCSTPVVGRWISGGRPRSRTGWLRTVRASSS